MTDIERPDSDDALRARLKSALEASPPEDLVQHVRSIAVRGASVHHVAARTDATTPGPIAKALAPAPARTAGRPTLRGWAEFLPPAAGAVLLAWLLGGALGVFGPSGLLARFFTAKVPSGATGATDPLAPFDAGPLPGFVLLVLASAAIVALLAEVTRGAPTLRRWLR